MKIFLAGATGVIGKRLVPLLIRHGHQVVAMTRSSEKAEGLRAAGAEPVVVADALDRAAVMAAVQAARPEAVIHQMTALSRTPDFRHFDQEFAASNRLRSEGGAYLLEAARAAGARRFIAQSYTGWPNPREGSRIKTEEDGFDPHPTANSVQTLAAIQQLETMVRDARDIEAFALRYGSFYGPGTAIAADGELVDMVRQHKLPVIGDGGGIWSFIHIDDVAEATRLALDRGEPGVYNVVDDEPAEVSVWLPELAKIIGAKPPMHVPAFMAKMLIGETGVSMMTQIRGSSNAKAKRQFAWQPAYATWREGFREFAR
jgi:nucleoside-diphosphate-sugar epimerase